MEKLDDFFNLYLMISFKKYFEEIVIYFLILRQIVHTIYLVAPTVGVQHRKTTQQCVAKTLKCFKNSRQCENRKLKIRDFKSHLVSPPFMIFQEIDHASAKYTLFYPVATLGQTVATRMT